MAQVLETRFIPFVDKPDTLEDASEGEASCHEKIYCDHCGVRLTYLGSTGYIEVRDVGEPTPEQAAHPMYLPDSWMACSRECADELTARYKD